MRYRTGKTLGKQQIPDRINKDFSDSIRRYDSIILNIFISIFTFFISTYAHIARSFLRVKLGERTFGVFTLVKISLMIPFIFIVKDVWIAGGIKFAQDHDWGFYKAIYYIFYPGSSSIWNITVLNLDKRLPEINSSVFMLISIILILTLGHLLDVYTRRLRKEITHSYYRGDSLLFWRMRGKKIWSRTITDTTIWMFIEPIFFFLIAIFIGRYWETQLGFVLQVSSICLFIEEYRVYKENQKFVLDIIDSKLDASYANEVQKEYYRIIERQEMEEAANIEYNASFNNSNSNTHSRKRVGRNSYFKARIT